MKQDDTVQAVGIVPDGAEAPPSGASAPTTIVAGRPRSPCGGTIRAPIDGEVRHRIGRNLKLLYADILTQPMPERFEALLADLATRRETP
ncbi:NepR family anti-sigma factor [uncultured Methylobacterium sp.]|uniref:NepR family anti-sigma factor n=1 Tax=uncultured Methylobacterium sp. TaxID=157278 RepID=UPI0035CC8365